MTIYSRPIRGWVGSRFVSDDKSPPDLKLLLWPFGPVGWKMHGQERLDFKKETARKVLNKVMRKSGLDTNNLLNELRNIVVDIRAAYPDDVSRELDDEGLIQLAADTNLFLLLLLSILGAQLKFPDQDAIFGTGCLEAGIENWLKSIFFVGNQIPLVMVKALMKSLPYLTELKEEIEKMEPPLELLQRTLYEFVTNDSEESKPTDVVDCLRSVILGPKSEPGSSEPTNEMLTLAASELWKEGFTFKQLQKKSGSREIRCENLLGNQVVHLPFLEVVSDMYLELLINSVAKFEDIHGIDSDHLQPEARCYFSLLSNLVRSPEDVEVLNQYGVIKGAKVDCLPRVLEPFYQMPPHDASRSQRRESLMHKHRYRQAEYVIFDKYDEH